MKLIDKDALVAEIQRRKELVSDPILSGNDLMIGERNAYFNLLSFIDALEVKEVDLDTEIIKWEESFGHYPASMGYKETAKHFFELGMKAKDWEKERMEECPYRQVGCTMYEGKILECRGACSWVVDYPKLNELKAKKGEKV